MGEAACTINSLKTFKKDMKRHIYMSVGFTFLFLFMMAIGGLIFYYIEHCHAPDAYTRKVMQNQQIPANVCILVQQAHKNLTANTGKFNNVSAVLITTFVDLCEKRKKAVEEVLKCELTLKTFWKWWDYCLTTSYTIGYGQSVTYSKAGRIITCFYAIPAIGITMAMNIYLGNLFVDGTRIFLVLFHTKVLKQRIIRNLSLKVFCYQVFVGVVVCFSYAEINRQWRFNNISMPDAMYFSFITLTTVGFGDIYYDREFFFRIEDIIKVAVTAVIFFVGMGVMASALTGLSELFTTDKRKTRRKNRFLMKMMKKMYFKRDGLDFKATLFNDANNSTVHKNPVAS